MNLEFKIFSAKIKSTSFKIRTALKVISSKLPIGVGTIYNIILLNNIDGLMINYYYETKFHLYNEFDFSKWIFFVVSKENKFIKELNFIFCDDQYLININNKYLNKNYYTDVITFDNSEDQNIDGDIFISIKRIKYNSLKFKKSFYDELKRVIIHAVLHLLGYKDKKETEKYIMSKKEDIYLFFLKKNMFVKQYDVIVVGGGHSGSEAALAASNLGSNTLLITTNFYNIGQMSCNPAMGGIAKGQMIKEIDALGGYSGIITDKSMIQFRMLNKSKGSAMWSPRAQCDRLKFSKEWRLTLEKQKNLSFFQSTVVDLIIKNYKVIGVKTILGIYIKSKSVILTNGTFLNGIIHIGDKKNSGGRISENSVKGLTEKLKKIGFFSGRMKTGTSPRLDGRSIDFSKMIEQLGDFPIEPFSDLSNLKILKQKKCYITHTNLETHKLLSKEFNRSPIFNGKIKCVGPRYCPSIEEKVYRFSNKENHQIFVEPEGVNTIEVYINGFSTSMPEEVQYKALLTIPGFENAKMVRPGYAIEYDYFPPTQLKNNLETKLIENLFFAGQINGTTGYEEAAAQGLIAGINANLKINEKDPFILKRNEAYIGVLIDDLIYKGTEEPYRMFTSRAEYRILLRQDNADERLTPLGINLGLVSYDRIKKLKNKNKKKKQCFLFFKLNKANNLILKENIKICDLLSRPEISIYDIIKLSLIKNFIKKNNIDQKILEQISLSIKYKGYLLKEEENVKKMYRLESIHIPNDFDYNQVKSISREAREKLLNYKPISIGEASRISGVSPSDIRILILFLIKK